VAVAAAPSGRPFTVLHYIERWLPRSESFVHGVVTNSRHPNVVVSAGRLENTDQYPHPDLVCLAPLWFRTPPKHRHQTVTACLMYQVLRHRARLVHVHHGYRGYEAKGVTRRLKLPLVVSLHGDDVTGYLDEHPDVYDGVLDRAAAVVVPSEFLVPAAVAAGARAEAVHVIPSGVDLSLFTPSPLPDGPPEAVFVGRFVEKKGLDVLAAAWPTVLHAVPDARLRILGYGPLESLARSIAGDVEVVVGASRSQVQDAIRRARVVVSPSHTAPGDAVETLLIANLEAQASGRPVVTTRHGGIPEFVRDGETALLVPEGDADALADALIRVLSDADLASRLGGAGPEWAAQFDIRRGAARLDDLYDSLVGA
jgi:glycosyltransferase involved in cell wall biosynthesis